MAKGYLISRTGEFTPPADGWVQVLAVGDFPNAEAGIVQHVDSESLDAITADFKAQAGQPNWPGMLVDFDHFSHDKTKPTGAAAWIDELDKRRDELWAHWRLTDTGAKAVNGGDYRLTSSVLAGFVPYDGAPSDKHLRPTKLVRVALTNDPNIKGMAPVSNRADTTEDETTATNKDTTMADTATAPAPAATGTVNHKALLTELLGLAEGASDEDIVKAIDMLKADAEADAGPNPDNDGDEATHPAAVENRSDVEELTAQVVALNREVAEAKAEPFFALVGEDKEVRAALFSLFAENREAAQKVFKSIKAPAAAEVVTKNRGDESTAAAIAKPFKPAFNRSVQPAPGGDQSDVGGGDVVKVAKSVREAAQEIFAANRDTGMTFSQAWTEAERKVCNRNGAGAAANATTTK